jgi:bifunctional DNA-binding transcriptional regulator/antitoxin component of YhaV-PrlF toxin-antitoxin module
LLVALQVRKRRRGTTRLTRKYQATIPKAAAAAAGIEAGDVLKVDVVGPGKLLVTREVDPIDQLVALGRKYPDVYPPGYLDELRAEWD